MLLTRRSAIALPLAAMAFPGAADAAVALAPPESVGFSSAGLKALNDEMHALVDQKKLAGVTTLVARHGKVVNFDAYGMQDTEAKVPMAKDTIFRIASMTKPIVGVAMMILWEEGKWKLDDPVHQHIPEFKDLKVKAADGALVPQVRPMTMRELMSHSAGFDVDAGYRDAGLSDTDLQGMIDKLAKLPLAYQAGTDWRYGPSVNIQGYVVEKLSGQTLDVFLQKRIFEPWGMKDTGFYVPESKAGRVTRIYTYENGLITPMPARPATTKPRFLSGSGGLLSTAEDYWRFAQAMANGAALDGKRVLKASTVELMRTNVLKPGVKVDLYGPSMEGVGFGLDFAIIMDPAAAGTPQGKNSFYWGGAFGTWFWIDPTNDLVFVGMIQNLNGSTPTGGTPPMRAISPRLVYAALTDPRK